MARIAYVHDETSSLLPYVGAGVFVASDIQVTRTVARTLHETDPLVLLAVALSVRAVREGQVCLSLDRVEESLGSGYFEQSDVVLPALPAVDEWVSHLSSSRAVRRTGGEISVSPRPLVLDGNRLYLDRYWHYELEVARQLLVRAQHDGGLFSEHLLAGGFLADHFDSADLGDPQRIAVVHALTRRLTVISGGPGTGKTRTIAQLLRQVKVIAESEGRSVLPALAAPTATAAKRMTLALHLEAENDKSVSGSTPATSDLQATTLHRLLGASPFRGFAHNRQNLLPHDLVVVDEASMVSLPLFARLLDAIKPDASLVLVGDPFQLESVEAGAVLGEIVGSTYANRPNGSMSEAIVQLEQQHRFKETSPVAAFADAIRNGQADEAIQILSASDSEELQWIDDEPGVDALYRRAAANAIEVIGAARRGDARAALESLVSLKVICATRHGHRGVLQWSARVEQLVKSHHPEYIGEHDWYIGRPIIVNRNDYSNHLFNGDAGVVVDLGGPVAVFSEVAEVRSVPLARLHDIDTWWAMTIHKSQGSEFESVIVSLPDAPSPVLSRELLYTAVTRAKHSVSVVASEDSLRVAIDRPSERSSGLFERLWGPGT